MNKCASIKTSQEETPEELTAAKKEQIRYYAGLLVLAYLDSIDYDSTKRKERGDLLSRLNKRTG